MEVVAALIWRGERMLLCRRPEGKACAGRWEFAGGKVEPGESGEAALRRECREELGVDVRVGAAVADVTQGERMHLTLYGAEIASGEPVRREHSDMRWLRPEELGNYPLCPADEELAARLSARGWAAVRREGLNG